LTLKDAAQRRVVGREAVARDVGVTWCRDPALLIVVELFAVDFAAGDDDHITAVAAVWV